LVPFILFAVAGIGAASATGRVTRLAAAAAITVVLALTYSRTAALVLVTGLVVLPFLQARLLGARAVLRGLIVIVTFAAVGWFIAGDLVRERFSGLRLGEEAIEAARTGAIETSLEWRLVNWGGLVTLGMTHPLTGHGLGMTTKLNPLMDYKTGLPFTAHDDFVRMFFEAGAIGLFLYVLYGALLCFWALGKARSAQPEYSPTALAVAAALIAMFFLTAGTAELGTQTAVQYELYGMLALMTAVEKRETERRRVPLTAEARNAGSGW
jgi:hypothetical protein